MIRGPMFAMSLTLMGMGLGSCCSSIECDDQGLSSLSLLQRAHQAARAARGGKQQREAGRPEWHECDQPPSEPSLLSHEAESLLQQLGGVLQPYDVRECFVTYIGEEADQYVSLASQAWVGTICETGFNAGHSATLLLSSNPRAKLYSFDLGVYPYSAVAAAFVNESFPGRFTLVRGDSTVTLPSFAKEHPDVRCDLMIADGGHTVEVAGADLKNFRQLANPLRNVIIMDDSACVRPICWGPEEAWQEAVLAGSILTIDRHKNPIQGWSVGSFNVTG